MTFISYFLEIIHIPLPFSFNYLHSSALSTFICLYWHSSVIFFKFVTFLFHLICILFHVLPTVFTSFTSVPIFLHHCPFSAPNTFGQFQATAPTFGHPHLSLHSPPSHTPTLTIVRLPTKQLGNETKAHKKITLNTLFVEPQNQMCHTTLKSQSTVLEDHLTDRAGVFYESLNTFYIILDWQTHTTRQIDAILKQCCNIYTAVFNWWHQQLLWSSCLIGWFN